MKSYFMSILTDQPNESFGAIVKRQLRLKEERSMNALTNGDANDNHSANLSNSQASVQLIQAKGASPVSDQPF